MRESTLTPNGRPAFLLVGLAIFLCQGELHAQEPAKEVYQDFRNKRPLLESFHLGGPPDVEGEIKAEDEGLRITLPAARTKHWPAEIIANFPISGDFEITATYELLSAAQPKKGYGVGVHLLIADNNVQKRFAKICRIRHATAGSVHLAEYWDRDRPKSYRSPSKKTEAMAGQLRMVRLGASLRFLVSDAPGQPFREIWYHEDFGADDLENFRFGVTDSGEPGNPVDARLIDLRIRYGGAIADKAFAPAPLADPAPAAAAPAPAPLILDPERKSGWLAVALIVGLGVLLMVGLGVAAWFYLRQRGPSSALPASDPDDAEEAEAAPATVSVSCAACGKKLKVAADLAGKKIKCKHCGKAVLVPEES